MDQHSDVSLRSREGGKVGLHFVVSCSIGFSMDLCLICDLASMTWLCIASLFIDENAPVALRPYQLKVMTEKRARRALSASYALAMRKFRILSKCLPALTAESCILQSLILQTLFFPSSYASYLDLGSIV